MKKSCFAESCSSYINRNFLGFKENIENITWPRGGTKFLFEC